MLNETLTGRNVVLKKAHGSLYFAQGRFVHTDAVSGSLADGYSIWRVQSYNSDSATLTLSVETGLVGESHFNISSEVNAHVFEGVAITRIILNRDRGITPHPAIANVRGVASSRPSNHQPERPLILETTQPAELPTKHRTYHLGVKVSDTEFVDGKVVFSVSIAEPRTALQLETSNPFVRMAFDPVKNYFAKFFANSEFQIVLDVAYQGNVVVQTDVVSTDITSIDEAMISRVNDVVVGRSLRDIPDDEFVEVGALTTILTEQDPQRNEQVTLRTLIQEGKTKHYHHLCYLSEKHDRALCKLKLTAKPTSFISVLREDNSVFVVWEPYSTDEATYLWRIKAMDEHETLKTIERIEDDVKLMRRSQKMAYRKQEKGNPDFRFIEHNYTLPKNGFDEWKQEVEAFLQG